jgi:hypothetical protein
VYRQGCRDSAQQWRAEHPGYWKQLREHNPERAERNRHRQQQRDERRRQRRLANNNSAPNLANNNPAIPQAIESKISAPSCQQQPSGQRVAFCPIKGSEPCSKETQAFLSKHPNRFQYVLTPKHGSWLNIVETLFGKMARTFQRHIRVQSLDELKTRILKGVAEINAAPVVHRWKNFKALEEI